MKIAEIYVRDNDDARWIAFMLQHVVTKSSTPPNIRGVKITSRDLFMHIPVWLDHCSIETLAMDKMASVTYIG
jgi:hypothetical protein